MIAALRSSSSDEIGGSPSAISPILQIETITVARGHVRVPPVKSKHAGAKVFNPRAGA
jgi:hypothetical protein